MLSEQNCDSKLLKFDQATRTPLKTGGELGCSEMVGSSCSVDDTCHVTLKPNSIHLKVLQFLSETLWYVMIGEKTGLC
jgi:hypothetical protein